MPNSPLEEITQKELLEIYDLRGNPLGVQARSSFYEEIRQEFTTNGSITRQVKIATGFLLNSRGGIYLQKRSLDKQENPGLYDKSVGGHVLAGMPFELTLVLEYAQELGAPVAVAASPHEFDVAVKSMPLSLVGICSRVDYVAPFNSVRINQDGSKINIPFMNQVFVGYYDGSIRFIDGESRAIEVFTAGQLKDQIRLNPNLFTEDLKFMVEKYEHHLRPIR